jgi:Flp pilus assembly secretin CpaC
VFVANSEIADVTLESPAVILVTAKKAGGTALFAMDDAGNILLNKFIEVRGGVSILRGVKEDTGAPPPGPIILQIPLSPAPR